MDQSSGSGIVTLKGSIFLISLKVVLLGISSNKVVHRNRSDLRDLFKISHNSYSVETGISRILKHNGDVVTLSTQLSEAEFYIIARITCNLFSKLGCSRINRMLLLKSTPGQQV